MRLLSQTLLLSVSLLLCGCPALMDASANEAGENPAALLPSFSDDAGTPTDVLTPAPASFHSEGDHEADVLIGGLGEAGSYDLYEFGPSPAGDRWSVTNRNLLTGAAFVVAVFDENMDLLARSGSGTDPSLTVVLRHDCVAVYVGVAAKAGGRGGAYYFHVSRSGGNQIPAPQTQRVWLDFRGAVGLRINRYDNLAFGAFSGAMIGEQFADTTDEIKQLIVDTLLRNYADYNITVMTSDTTVPPSEPYTTVYFGGRGDAQLGVAANVDAYNADPQQNAVVFVEALADYEGMPLTVAQVGTMLGNIASHELGHLLGLHHVRGGENVMSRADADTIWDMAGPQHFGHADLDPQIFPVGRLHAPRLLEETVGVRDE